MKKILFISAVLLTSLAACDDYIDKFDVDYELTDEKSISYTLTSSDYTTIANYSSNQEIAEAKGTSYSEALAAVATNKYFTSMAPAEDYIPALLEAKYPNATDGSSFKVTYNLYQGTSAYLDELTDIDSYTLSSSDYNSVWGETSTATYLTPKTVSKLSSILASEYTDAADGDAVVVNYLYSEFEPASSGSSTASVTYYLIDDEDDLEAGDYVIAALYDGEYYPFGKTTSESYSYGYMYPDPITVTDGTISSSDAEEQVVTIGATDNGYTLMNSWEQYVYASGTYSSFNFSTSLPDSGAEWAITENGDGTFSIQNLTNEYYAKFSTGYASYGAYSDSKFLYFSDDCSEDTGNFTANDITLPGSSTYVWSHNSYGYWKASGYVSGNQDSESWLTTTVDLSSASNPVLAFTLAINYASSYDPADYFSVKVSSDYSGDVTTATWTDLDVDLSSVGTSWTWYTASGLDLSSFAGSSATIAFVYKSTTDCATTVEIKNVKVTNSAYLDVYLFKAMTEDEISAGAVMAKASGSSYNTSALYTYDGSSWSEYETDEATIVVAQPSFYSDLGADKVSKPDNVLPTYLLQVLPYASKNDKAGVVYIDSSEDMAISEYTYDGSAWSASKVYSTSSTTFVLEDGEYSAQASTYLSETLLGDTGGFTYQDILLTGVTYVWTNTSSYGWKASGYTSSTNYNCESWLVSPEIDLSSATAPGLSFDEAHRYLNSEPLTDYFKIMVSTDYSGDVESCSWDQIEIDETEWSDGSDWTYYTVGPYDLSAYCGYEIRFAIVYISTTTAAPTLEIKNVEVSEME